MLTSARHDHVRKMKRRRTLSVAIGVVLALFLFRGFFLPSLAATLHFVVRPVWVAYRSAGEWLSVKSSLLRSNATLTLENRRLQEELDAVALDAHTRDLLRDENDMLKEMLGRPREEALILATILARPDRSPYDTFVIDIGRDAGLKEGWKVYADGDLVLGEVVAVHGRSAVVRLYSSSGVELPVMVGSSTPLAATAYGLGGGNFRIALPRGTEIVPGDIVTVPALGLIFAGIVESVEEPDSSSFVIVRFKLPVNWNTLRSVYVGVPLEAAPEAKGADNV